MPVPRSYVKVLRQFPSTEGQADEPEEGGDENEGASPATPGGRPSILKLYAMVERAGAVSIYPAPYFQRTVAALYERVNAYPDDLALRDYVEELIGDSCELKLDAQGRLNIPAGVLRAAQIPETTQRFQFRGLFDKVELRDEAKALETALETRRRYIESRREMATRRER